MTEAAATEEEQESPAEEAENPKQLRDELIESFDEVQRQALVEALLFTNGSPVTVSNLATVTGLKSSEVEDILESIRMRHSLDESGVELFEAEGRYQLRSKEAFGPFIQQLKASRPKRLSQQALETLAIVAYRQPIVKSDVEKIRGVDATPTLKTLIDRGFIKIVGHQPSIGQPALYGTTTQFLEVFGLSSLSELPSLKDLKELEAETALIEEEQAEDQQEEIAEEESQENQEFSENPEEDSEEPAAA